MLVRPKRFANEIKFHKGDTWLTVLITSIKQGSYEQKCTCCFIHRVDAKHSIDSLVGQINYNPMSLNLKY